ncbi:MAG: hypothetical protein K2G41_04525 [Duncaniella sp.]|uniref:hypothetical protein n=1 Tax=Duncaniella sp. TaxID=2518496 RepID=UPI0023C8AB37|nr:hypothetical protein [Duncaniella sp.]MDE6089946.1 hypothetical protein [Duncaniella sp.]
MKAFFSNQGRFFNTTLKTLPAALLMAGMVSCSDDSAPSDPNKGDDAQKTELEKSALKVFTNPADMPSRVINFSFGNSGSRAINPDIDLDAFLEEVQKIDFSTITEFTDPNIFYNNPNQLDTKQLVVSGELKGQLQNFGSTVYVKGKWTITGFNANTWQGLKATIVVLPGAELEFDMNKFQGDNCLTIYNFGKLTSTVADDQEFNLEGVTLYSKANIDQIKRLGFQSEVYVDGAVVVDYIHISGTSEVYINCKLEASEKVRFDNDQIFHVGYIKSPEIELMANAKVALNDGAYIETDLLKIDNVQSCQIYALDDDVALIKATSIQVNNVGPENLKGTFSNLNLLCENWIYGENVEPTKDALGLNASVNYNEENGSVKLEADNDPNSCAPIFVTIPTDPTDPTDPTIPTDPTDKPKLETISFITNEHSHPISATCIQFDGNKAYVSWHERGQGIQGCIEVVERTAEGIKLLAYAQDPNTDYNHIIVDGNRLLAVGHNANHAIVGEIALSGGTFANNAEIAFTHLKGNRVAGADNPEFYGGDGNCIVRNGQYLSVASYGGFHTLTSDLKRLNDDRDGAVATAGSGKHLSLCGDKILTLNLSEKNSVASMAELRLYDANDYTWSNPTVVATDLKISPVDGKNTIALDKDGSIYVALGQNGLKKYNQSGATVAEYHAGEFGVNPANGLAVDDKYLYVAFGSGLYIFDKNDITKPVLTYTNGKPGATNYPGNTAEDGINASCNYVAVDGDIIYLAYGRNGVDVLRMINR